MKEDLNSLVTKIGRLLTSSGHFLAVAESCTGGMLSETLTSLPGSSEWFERGFVTYSNLAKVELLGVRPETLKIHGAVSEQVVKEMVQGVLQRSHAHFSMAISGVAGPGGGTVEKPVGTVWLAWTGQTIAVKTECHLLTGDRNAIRTQATQLALTRFCELLEPL